MLFNHSYGKEYDGPLLSRLLNLDIGHMSHRIFKNVNLSIHSSIRLLPSECPDKTLLG
jgi:hypothetical protein